MLGLCLPGVRAGETVFMQVYLNHADVGEHFFQLEGASPVFTRDVLHAFGLVNLPPGTGGFDGAEHVSLETLGPGLRYRIDEREAALYIHAPVEYFQVHAFEQAGFAAPADLEFANQASAFLNYGLDLSHQGESGRKVISAPLELIAHKGRISAYSNFIYTNTERESRLSRLMTSATIDSSDAMTRLTLGDFVAAGGRNGGGGVYGGISYSRVFSINPYFNRYTGLLINGAVESPSQVDYYLGENLLFSQNVPPGPFVVRDLASPAGSHQAHMVITDAFGNSTATSSDIYFASRLLKPGVHEFSYNLGARRENFGRENASYGELTALGFHRFGINRDLTLGARVELYNHVVNNGTEAHIRVSSYFQAQLMNTDRSD